MTPMTNFHFFFQAEDGIRDTSVTGVQTCALPISSIQVLASGSPEIDGQRLRYASGSDTAGAVFMHVPAFGRCAHVGGLWFRSEERRVGKESVSQRACIDFIDKRIEEHIGIVLARL